MEEKQKKVIALGFFDGVHLGHQALLRTAVQRAEEWGMTPAVFTFDRSPKEFVTGVSVPLLTTAEERAAADALRKQLKEMPVRLQAKAGTGGRLFGSITTKEISEALKAQYGVDIPKAKLVQEEPIKSFGTFEVKAKLYPEIQGAITVVVTEL